MNPGPTPQMQGGCHHGVSSQSLDRLHMGRRTGKCRRSSCKASRYPDLCIRGPQAWGTVTLVILMSQKDWWVQHGRPELLARELWMPEARSG